MSWWRRVPPVHSPLTASALVAGWGAALTPGSSVQLLEDALRARFDAGAAVLTDSGTSALALAIAVAQRAHPGSPVALPAYCCYDVATSAVAADAPVLLYDLDPTTLGPDWTSFERCLASGAKAVVVAHLFGLAVDVDRALSLCTATGAVLIEDAAQGAGGRWRGRPLGSSGPLSVLSFGRGKGMTGGNGGALLARGALTATAQALGTGMPAANGDLRALTAATAQWLLGRPSVYGLPAALPFLRLGETVYREPHAPRALGAGPALVARRSLDGVEDEARIRRARAAELAQVGASAGLRGVTPASGSEPGYLRFPLVLNAAGAAAAAAAGRLGIARAYPRTLAQLPALATRCRNIDAAVPGADHLAAGLYTAPTHSHLSDKDLARLVAWIAALPGQVLA